MNRINMIVVLVALAVACVPSDEGSSQPSEQVGGPASAWKSTKNPSGTATPRASPAVSEQAAVTTLADTATDVEEEQGMKLLGSWPSGAEMQTEVDGFMAAGFMQDPRPVGFGDLAYSDNFLDFEFDSQGRIDQVNGKLRELYDSYSFVIPVVGRRVDAISGSRQVNWEDVIVKLDETRWHVQPVALRGATHFEIRIDSSIEIIKGDTVIRVVKNGSVFTCTEHSRKADGQEELKLSWQISQYERGPVHDIQYSSEPGSMVPVVMAWDPVSIAGYIVSLPEGMAVFVHRLGWEPTGVLETDRYNFLVLLSQLFGGHLAIPDRLGAVDPVWLALLLYDYVVLP